MISFALEEEQELLRDLVRKFAAEEVRPNMRAWERAGELPARARQAFARLGLALLDVPESLGGGGAGALSQVLVQEELAHGDPGAAVALCASGSAVAAILELADGAQAERLLARLGDGDAGRAGAVAWSDRAPAGEPLPLEGFATVAEPATSSSGGGYRLRGEKAFVVNGGRADVTVVFAQVEPGRGWDGAGAFVVESPGASHPAGMLPGERHRLLGLETAYAAGLRFDGCFVPEENRLRGGSDFAAAARRYFQRVALTTAARQVGLARAAYELALEYTQERKAFGKPVAHFQSIAFTLAEMHMDVESARWMVWRAATEWDRGPGAGVALTVAQAATHANEAAFRVADNGVQLLGGAGYIQDFPVEKWLRDTKALALFAPSDQLCQLEVASSLLGHAIEPGLPSSAIQPIFT